MLYNETGNVAVAVTGSVSQEPVAPSPCSLERHLDRSGRPGGTAGTVVPGVGVVPGGPAHLAHVSPQNGADKLAVAVAEDVAAIKERVGQLRYVEKEMKTYLE